MADLIWSRLIPDNMFVLPVISVPWMAAVVWPIYDTDGCEHDMFTLLYLN